MIESFGNKITRRIWDREYQKNIPKDVQKLGRRKLVLINLAESIEDLRVIPGNRLKLLTGRRAGQYSIRINDQWRICFTWHNNSAFWVEIVDYH